MLCLQPHLVRNLRRCVTQVRPAPPLRRPRVPGGGRGGVGRAGAQARARGLEVQRALCHGRHRGECPLRALTRHTVACFAAYPLIAPSPRHACWQANGRALKYVHPSLRGLGEYVVAAVDAKRGNEPGAMAWASGKLLASRDFVQLCLSRNPLCFKFLPAEFKGEELGSFICAVPSTVQRARRHDRFETLNPPFSSFYSDLFSCRFVFCDRGLGDGDVNGHVTGGGRQALGAARGRPAAALAQPEKTICRPRRHAPWTLPNKALPLPRLMQQCGFWLGRQVHCTQARRELPLIRSGV